MIGLPTPEKEEEFTVDWATPILQDYYKRTNNTDPSDIKVLSVKAKKNELQGILSITYVVDVEFEVRPKSKYDLTNFLHKFPILR